MKTHEIKPSTCPFCNYKPDLASNIPDEKGGPVAGDVTICINCGEWCVFGPEMELQKPTDEVYDAIVENPKCTAVRQAWLIMKAAGIQSKEK